MWLLLVINKLYIHYTYISSNHSWIRAITIIIIVIFPPRACFVDLNPMRPMQKEKEPSKSILIFSVWKLTHTFCYILITFSL